MKYKHIIFDFGNVLARFDEKLILGKYCPAEEDFQLMKEAIFYDWEAMDKGTIEYDVYIEHATGLLPERLHPAMKEFSQTWYRQLLPMYETWAFVKEIKEQGYSAYVLSNAPAFFAEHADFFEVTKQFDGMVFSGPLQMAKPEPEIYQYLFDTYQLNPEECLFLDDKKENIEAAQAAGMDGIVFTGNIQMVKEKLKG